MRQSNVRVACALALTLAACGGQPQPERTPPADAKRVDLAQAGRISGRVVIEGKVPANPVAQTASDPVCARENQGGLQLEDFVVENGGLNNVFVHVKSGLGSDYHFDAPTEAVKLDQNGCRYTPHVFGAQVGQPIEISNSDSTMHNVSAAGSVNRGFNFGQPMQGFKNTTSFTAAEVMVKFKCNVHPWMTAYAGILAHPYFGVTAGGGTFDLKNVPAGTYVVEAWHEKLGTLTETVALGAKESKDVTFTFKGPISD